VPSTLIRAASYFDGDKLHPENAGPYLIAIRSGQIESVAQDSPDAPVNLVTEFVMPGLVDAHVHIFLDGGELDPDKRNAYLHAGHEEMMRVARRNIARTSCAGVTLSRDAGDRHGINHAMRDELRDDPTAVVRLRSAGVGLKRAQRYGSFLARDVGPVEQIPPVIQELAAASDDIKVILTGIIDFEAGTVKGAPQFDVQELQCVIAEARRHGHKTLAHCSGAEGLKVAVEAGIGSIEHGFFMTRELLPRMADKGIAWVPTFSPVHFQWARPEVAGWSQAAIDNLRRILDSHLEHVELAHKAGVEIIAGSDAGSPGVKHGAALIDELFHFLAAGLPLEEVLRSATSRPRRLWNAPSANIEKGAPAELVLFDLSPFAEPKSLRRPQMVISSHTSQKLNHL
jgi:imidazolonepropionase-like amidohydrolase